MWTKECVTTCLLNWPAYVSAIESSQSNWSNYCRPSDRWVCRWHWSQSIAFPLALLWRPILHGWSTRKYDVLTLIVLCGEWRCIEIRWMTKKLINDTSYLVHTTNNCQLSRHRWIECPVWRFEYWWIDGPVCDTMAAMVIVRPYLLKVVVCLCCICQNHFHIYCSCHSIRWKW